MDIVLVLLLVFFAVGASILSLSDKISTIANTENAVIITRKITTSLKFLIISTSLGWLLLGAISLVFMILMLGMGCGLSKSPCHLTLGKLVIIYLIPLILSGFSLKTYPYFNKSAFYVKKIAWIIIVSISLIINLFFLLFPLSFIFEMLTGNSSLINYLGNVFHLNDFCKFLMNDGQILF